MIFKINGALSNDSSNPSSLPLSILPYSSVILVTRKNKFTRILSIKKEPYGSDAKILNK